MEVWLTIEAINSVSRALKAHLENNHHNEKIEIALQKALTDLNVALDLMKQEIKND